MKAIGPAHQTQDIDLGFAGQHVELNDVGDDQERANKDPAEENTAAGPAGFRERIRWPSRA